MTYHVNHLLGKGESGVSDKYFSYFSVQTYIVNDHKKCLCEAFLMSTYYVFHSLFVLRFYGPVNPMGSCRARSVYRTTRLLGRLSPLSG